MKTPRAIQYTLRQVPGRVDHTLRERSRQSRRSLNAEAIEALSRGLGLTDEAVRHHDLDSLAGTWREDAAFDAALAAQDRVDVKLWK